MKKRVLSMVLAVSLAILMISGTTLTASAAYDPYRALEEKTRQAVAAAIENGLVPPGTTIYECAYSRDANGATIVVQYMDDGGNWIDVYTGKPAAVAETPAPTQKDNRLSEEELAEYAAECLRLVNEDAKRQV